MSIVQCKRFRMRIDLAGQVVEAPPLPPEYRLAPWQSRWLEMHAEAKHASFKNELDSIVFSCLSTAAGCLQLMRDISCQSNFVPQATWLGLWTTADRRTQAPVATIQGMRDTEGVGSIQNVGVVPGHRDRGLGTQLLVHALRGFQQVGLRAATLEVTAKNVAAVRLYQRMGFEIEKVVYRTVQLHTQSTG